MMAKYVLLIIVMFAVLAVAECCYTDVSIACSSDDNQYQTCKLSTSGVYNEIKIIEKYSSSSCTKCESYGFRDGHVWVAKGCSGQFVVRVCRKYSVLDCDSTSSQYNECDVPGARNVGYVLLASKRSESACNKDSSYGINRNQIWVAQGCSGKFHVCFE